MCAALLIFRQGWLSEKVEIVDIYHFSPSCKCRLTRPVRASELRKSPEVNLKPAVNSKWHTRQLQITMVSEHQNFWKSPHTHTNSTRNIGVSVSQSIPKLVRCEKADWKNRDGSTQLNYTSYLLFSSIVPCVFLKGSLPYPQSSSFPKDRSPPFLCHQNYIPRINK